jgi:hypothetical protein
MTSKAELKIVDRHTHQMKTPTAAGVKMIKNSLPRDEDLRALISAQDSKLSEMYKQTNRFSVSLQSLHRVKGVQHV